jgi:hypothetical protein
MKIGSSAMGILIGLILVGSISIVTLQQQAFAFGFVESQQIGEFRKLTGDFVQNIIKNQQSPNSKDVTQFRILTAQFERDVINAVLNDHPVTIKVLAGTYSGESLPLSLGEEAFPLIDDYLQAALRIFCKPCT